MKKSAARLILALFSCMTILIGFQNCSNDSGSTNQKKAPLVDSGSNPWPQYPTPTPAPTRKTCLESKGCGEVCLMRHPVVEDKSKWYGLCKGESNYNNSTCLALRAPNELHIAPLRNCRVNYSDEVLEFPNKAYFRCASSQGCERTCRSRFRFDDMRTIEARCSAKGWSGACLKEIAQSFEKEVQLNACLEAPYEEVVWGTY